MSLTLFKSETDNRDINVGGQGQGGMLGALTEGTVALLGLGLLILFIVVLVWILYRKISPYLGLAQEYKSKRELKGEMMLRERALNEREEREMKSYHLRQLTIDMPRMAHQPHRVAQERLAQELGRNMGVQRARDVEENLEIDPAGI